MPYIGLEPSGTAFIWVVIPGFSPQNPAIALCTGQASCD